MFFIVRSYQTEEKLNVQTNQIFFYQCCLSNTLSLYYIYFIYFTKKTFWNPSNIPRFIFIYIWILGRFYSSENFKRKKIRERTKMLEPKDSIETHPNEFAETDSSRDALDIFWEEIESNIKRTVDYLNKLKGF